MQYEIPQNISLEDIHATFDKVIIHRVRPTKSKGGIILTDAAQQYLADNIGVIINIGPSVDESLHVGDVVFFGKQAGDWTKIPNSDEEFFIALDTDIYAIVKNKESN